ncbi:MAG: DUF2818 family protein [Chromatiales bacterium]|jgi:hypothetical protein|nr:DUF2818 family protein [Chromatiales bacterium]MDX9766382.1 DUF2818 family protein [Ectothiorhodospiraceae bacterium]
MADTAVWLFLLLALVAANLPWLSERVLFVLTPEAGVKPVWVRLGEWLMLYLVVGAIGLGLERQVTGGIHGQEWEFYAITFCLFMVFALPGFIFRHDLLKLLRRRA